MCVSVCVYVCVSATSQTSTKTATYGGFFRLIALHCVSCIITKFRNSKTKFTSICQPIQIMIAIRDRRVNMTSVDLLIASVEYDLINLKLFYKETHITPYYSVSW